MAVNMNRLLKQRAICKASISRVKTFVESWQKSQGIIPLQLRLEQLLKAWGNYEEVQTEIELNDEDDTYISDREEVETKVYEVRGIIQHELELHNTTLQENAISEVSNQGAFSRLKLPTIKLPIFDGKYEQWLLFSETFKSLVHNNRDVATIQKYHYLLSALSGQALQLVQNLQLSESNYMVAWNLLEERYNNKRLIAATHIHELLNIRQVTKESANELIHFINSISSNLNALTALNIDTPLADVLLIHLFTHRLDANTRKEWELTLSNQMFPTVKTFLQFLECRRQALENSKPIGPSHERTVQSANIKVKPLPQYNSYVATLGKECDYCQQSHIIYRCSKFLDLSLNDKIEFIRKSKNCFNCLRSSHQAKFCQSTSKCKLCGKLHHTLLHREVSHPVRGDNNETPSGQQSTHRWQQGQATSNDQANSGRSFQPQQNYCTIKGQARSSVLLSTALVSVTDANGQSHICRALLDSASQSNFCTERLVQRLRLPRHNNMIPIRGINNITSETKHCVTIPLQGRNGEFKDTISCSVLSHITGCMPETLIQYQHWNIPVNLELADPSFFEPGNIDLLLGVDIFFGILRGGHMTRPGNFPVLQETALGWIIAGRFQHIDGNEVTHSDSFVARTDNSLELQLQRFWELEEFHDRPKTSEEKECEQHFRENVTRDHSGRFIVRLPRRTNYKPLGASFDQASRRLQHLEGRLRKQPELRKEYNAFMTEYEQLGHMKQMTKETTHTNQERYFIPHHAVFKESSSTTKTRVVFDASAKTTSGVSLNDTLMVGPTIQQDLYSIVLRFRTHRIAFTADIAKMYRQIRMHPEDTSLQCILWRTSTDEPVKCFELTTVTYGTAPAPFLATRCLEQLAEEGSAMYPYASRLLKRDFYIDDVLSGHDNVHGALQLQSELISLLNSGGFPLRKWSSNHPALIEAVPNESREPQLPLHFDGGGSVTTLGLLWQPKSDKFLIATTDSTLALAFQGSITKRKVSSIVASIFDPLGLVSPMVILYKVFLQKLWLCKLNWDETLSTTLRTEWQHLAQHLTKVTKIEVDRLVICKNTHTRIEVHGFCDASERAYGACLYLRSTDKEGNITVSLLCSKSRVSPVKQVSIPRLELCGAVLLSQLIHRTLPILNLKINNVQMWTDSSIVLAWLASPATRWNTFVGNRVSQIQEVTNVNDWKHVASEHNPADLISRGVEPAVLKNLDFWWHGPQWLRIDSDLWKSSTPITDQQDVPEQRPIVVMLATQSMDDAFMNKFSTLSKLQRVVAYCQRFSYNSRNPTQRKTSNLTAGELQAALQACIRIVQGKVFQREKHDLQNQGQVSRKSKLADLHPFLDNEDLLRVGGRLQQSNLAYEHKHQVILPTTHHITQLIIAAEHTRLLHAGSQLLLATLRQQYWIPKAKPIIRRLIHQCIRCFKLKASASSQLMGQLPQLRVVPARPFINTGVDYAGPLMIKSGTTRSKTSHKCYVAVFVCFTTKAVHLELVSNLSSEAFIAALRRFTARRGKCLNLYSDNGTNFVGAQRELHELRELFLCESFNKDMQDYASKELFTWHFIPPCSPHFGGLWEAAVKSMKFHLRRVVGNARLTYEELTTLLAQVEACLNSRPLTVLSNDPHDPSFLSPGHFLIGSSLMCHLEPDLQDQPVGRLSRWQYIQQLHQQLWRRWSQDYLNGLQQRRKWSATKSNLHPGTVVILREDNTLPLHWRLAVVEEVHPGKDGLVRVATIRTANNRFKRPIHKLCVLPFQEDDVKC